MKRVSDMKAVTGIPEGESILEMKSFHGYVYVSTSGGVYRIDGTKAVPVTFVSTSSPIYVPGIVS